jgi:hypothetical protein
MFISFERGHGPREHDCVRVNGKQQVIKKQAGLSPLHTTPFHTDREDKLKDLFALNVAGDWRVAFLHRLLAWPRKGRRKTLPLRPQRPNKEFQGASWRYVLSLMLFG